LVGGGVVALGGLGHLLGEGRVESKELLDLLGSEAIEGLVEVGIGRGRL
jgi:hypothetical protein